MEMKRFRALRRAMRCVLVTAVFGAVVAVPWSDTNAQAGPAYSVDFHVISSAAHRVHNSCFVLNGTAGQAAPGYSFGAGYSVLSGFWVAAPTTGQDQLFFDGFEGC